MLTLSDISVKHDDQFALSVPELNVAQGQQIIITGASGSGKSTLLNVISGLLKPHTGTIRLDDTVYSTLPQSKQDAFRRKNIGMVFQKPHLIGHLSAAANIQLANPKADLKALLTPLGMAHMAHKPASTLSGGEAIRVSIARAIANTPRIILADEPTSHLDDANTNTVMELLENAAKTTNATLIIATHDARILPRITKQISLQNGQISHA